MTIRVLLDIDGVLNAVTRNAHETWPDGRVSHALGFRIVWSPTVIGFVRSLHEQGVDVRWLTTWGHMANTHLAPLVGLPEFAVAGEAVIEDAGWWKLACAQALYEADPAPFVWIDDDIDFDDEALEWLSGLPLDQVLAIAPNTSTGLTDEHLKLITAFVELHGS